MKAIALFDIADQGFTFYTEVEWSNEVEGWREELAEAGYSASVEDLDVDEVVEMIGGNEYFYAKIV